MKKQDRERTEESMAEVVETLTEAGTKKSNAVLKTVLGVSAGAALLSTAAVAGCFALAARAVGGKRHTEYETMLWQMNRYDTSWFDEMTRTEYIVPSYDGYELHTELIEKPGTEGNKYVILSHGHADGRLGNLKYLQLYLDRGFRCIIYDLRGHGDNVKDAQSFCTFGIREGEDLAALILDTYNRYGKDIVLGLHGESMGTSITIESLGYQQDVDFVVADCGYADIENVMRGILREKHVPAKVVDFASAAAKLKYGYSFHEMRPIDSLLDNRVPILFLHGEEDSFVGPANSKRMAEVTSGYSELHLIPGAGHAESVLKQPKLYKEYVDRFLDDLEV